MAEISSFFNSIEHDRRYFAEDFARHLKKYFTNGVFNNELAVIANNDMSITIKKGDANIEGYRYTNTVDLTKGIEIADGTLKRIDNVVLRLDLTNRLISAQIIKGTYSDAPSAPDLVRTSTIYDIKLAEITVNNSVTSITQSAIKDTRPDNNLCGIVASTVKTLDITDVYNQLYTKYNELIEEHNNDWNTWYEFLKESIDTWFKGTKQQYSDKLSEFETNFNTWFDTIKGKLSGDVAANLQKEIDNRYTKEETYSKEEIEKKLLQIPRLEVEIVSQLPTEKISGTTIYLISTDDAIKEGIITINQSGNSYQLNTQKFKISNENILSQINNNELSIQPISTNLKNYKTTEIATINFPIDTYYLACFYKNENWIIVGTTKTDLSDYVKKSELPTKLSQLTNDMFVKCNDEEDAKSKSAGDTQHLYYWGEEQ